MIRYIEAIERFRTQIDRIDRNIIQLLAERFRVVRGIGMLKQNNGLSIVDLKRYREIVRERIEYGKKMEISLNFIKKFFSSIHAESVRVQKARILQSAKPKKEKTRKDASTVTSGFG